MHLGIVCPATIALCCVEHKELHSLAHGRWQHAIGLCDCGVVVLDSRVSATSS